MNKGKRKSKKNSTEQTQLVVAPAQPPIVIEKSPKANKSSSFSPHALIEQLRNLSERVKVLEKQVEELSKK